MKKRSLFKALAVIMVAAGTFGVTACSDDGRGEGKVDGNIEGTYYLTLCNGSDFDAYVHESEYIKLEDGMCEFSCGWKSYPDQQEVAPFICSYAVTDETFGYTGKRIIFNVNDVDTVNEYIDRYKSYLDKTYIWYNGALQCIGDAQEIKVAHGEPYDTYKNRTYCKTGAKPSSYARGYYSVFHSGDKYIADPPPAGRAFYFYGDTIKNGSKYVYTESRMNPNGFGIYTFEVKGTCKVSGGVIEFKDEDNDVFMYGKVRGRVLYSYSDKTDMSETNWQSRHYRYNTATDLDITRPRPIIVADSAAIAELDSSNG